MGIDVLTIRYVAEPFLHSVSNVKLRQQKAYEKAETRSKVSNNVELQS